MDLVATPISRNLRVNMSLMGLEVPDLIAVVISAGVAMFATQAIAGQDTLLFGFLPANWAAFLFVVLVGVPGLMIFKYGKPRGYLIHLIKWHTTTHVYGGAEADKAIDAPFVKEASQVAATKSHKSTKKPEQTPTKQQRPNGAPLSTLIPLRDVDSDTHLLIRTDGSYVAGYRLRGAFTYFAGVAERNAVKARLDAMLRSCPEQSVRIQIRYEIDDQIGTLLDDYVAARRSTDADVIALDNERVSAWRERAANGEFLTHHLSVYFIWAPDIHSKVLSAAGIPNSARRSHPSMSPRVKDCIQEEEAVYRDRVVQFTTILRGIESSMSGAALEPVRLTGDEMIERLQVALSPKNPMRVKPRQNPVADRYVSVRQQVINSNLFESDVYCAVDGILWAVITLKEPPEQTVPGIMRELQTLGFPLAISTNIAIPNQTEMLQKFKGRHKRALNSQVNHRGEFRPDMQAQVAAEELADIQARLMSSATRVCHVSVTIAFRSSNPYATKGQLEYAEQELALRREQILHVFARMDGASAMPEIRRALTDSLIRTLPGFSDNDQRDVQMLSANAADMSPIEMPWAGTPRSPMVLMETPYRQLIPFNPFDASFDNANSLVTATSGSGKSMLAQKLLLSMGRTGIRVSILEKGDSYINTVRFMGGSTINMSLDSELTINPFDYPMGDTSLTNDHKGFLITLLSHMIGESAKSDPDILKGVLETCILGAYTRAEMKDDPIPLLSDVHAGLSSYNTNSQLIMAEAQMATLKLRPWIGKGIYASLFDRPTTVDMSVPWLYFNIEKLQDDLRLQTAMSMLIAYTTSKRADGKSGISCMTVLDECWSMLDDRILAREVEQLFRTGRKRNSGVMAVSQAVEDFTGTPDAPNKIGGAILATTAIRLIGRQKGNDAVLHEFLHLPDAAVNHVKNIAMTRKGERSEFQISMGESSANIHSFLVVLAHTEYWLATSFPRERQYRHWWLTTYRADSFAQAIIALALRFPHGLAEIDELPEERSGEVRKSMPLPDLYPSLTSSLRPQRNVQTDAAMPRPTLFADYPLLEAQQ